MSWVISRTLFMLRAELASSEWHSSQIDLIIRDWLNSQSFLRNEFVVGCYSITEVIRTEMSSSTKMKPEVSFTWLKARSKYWGHWAIGESKICLTFLYEQLSESPSKTWTTSGEDHTSIRAGLASCKSESGPIFLAHLANEKVLSSPEMYALIAFVKNRSWRLAFYHF